jgi:hypothetical protein
VSSDQFEDLAKGLATASTRRRALGAMAGGVAALWGLMRTPLARANQACAHSEECRDSTKCCCILPHGPLPGVCLRPDQCFRMGGFCLGTKKG